jgi:hypothetical protein
VTCLLDRSAGSKTDPIEMTVIDRALCAVDLARYDLGSTGCWLRVDPRCLGGPAPPPAGRFAAAASSATDGGQSSHICFCGSRTTAVPG